MNFHDLIDLGDEEISSLSQNGPSPESRARRAEGMLRHLYALAASVAKTSETLEEARDVWSTMNQICRKALQAAARLRESGGHGSADALENVALDFMTECEKRLKHVLEEISCQSLVMPPGLFPSLK